MSLMASQITSLTIVYSTSYSGVDQRKHQSSASLAFVLGIHRGPVNSPHKRPVTRKMFPFDDVIMIKMGCLDAQSRKYTSMGGLRLWELKYYVRTILMLRLSLNWIFNIKWLCKKSILLLSYLGHYMNFYFPVHFHCFGVVGGFQCPVIKSTVWVKLKLVDLLWFQLKT